MKGKVFSFSRSLVLSRQLTQTTCNERVVQGLRLNRDDSVHLLMYTTLPTYVHRYLFDQSYERSNEATLFTRDLEKHGC